MATVYDVNKGINRAIEFKGFKAQYITYMAIGLVALLLCFAILYAVGLGLYYCIGIVAAGGIGLVVTIQRMSKTYGQHGLTKRMALRNIPRALRGANRNYFISLNHLSDEKK